MSIYLFAVIYSLNLQLDYAAKIKSSPQAEKYYAETVSTLNDVLAKLGWEKLIPISFCNKHYIHFMRNFAWMFIFKEIWLRIIASPLYWKFEISIKASLGALRTWRNTSIEHLQHKKFGKEKENLYVWLFISGDICKSKQSFIQAMLI